MYIHVPRGPGSHTDICSVIDTSYQNISADLLKTYLGGIDGTPYTLALFMCIGLRSAVCDMSLLCGIFSLITVIIIIYVCLFLSLLSRRCS